MTPSDPHEPPGPGDNALACSIIACCLALLCFLLGWAQGVRKDTTYLHVPENGHFLIATAILLALGIFFFAWSRLARRS